jgi:hypothetical protein
MMEFDVEIISMLYYMSGYPDGNLGDDVEALELSGNVREFDP